MKTYSKIVGIILTIAGIGGFIGVIAGIIDSNDIEEKVGISLLFIPCILFLHYMYIHNFGFSLKSEIPKKNYRIILILTILSLVISIIVPVGYLLNQINIQKNAEQMIDRGTDEVTSANIKGRLKTKYENGKLLYVLNIASTSKTTELDSNIETFIIELKDKDGFKIEEIEIKDYTNLVDDKVRFGISSNSSKWISLKDYLKISDWDLIYRTKN
ncbi:hypothetical protein [Tenacibaculum piscium]|uniref:hypothetical protein n=1 Tax=Tenacibaculum piscium TaxID=1458515 RepID=UPI001F4607C8|nr:hypothetical protein [Tenacibaculum piscium]